MIGTRGRKPKESIIKYEATRREGYYRRKVLLCAIYIVYWNEICAMINGGRETFITELSFIGIRTLFDQITRGYGDHSPLTRPKEEVTHGERCRITELGEGNDSNKGESAKRTRQKMKRRKRKRKGGLRGLSSSLRFSRLGGRCNKERGNTRRNGRHRGR